MVIESTIPWTESRLLTWTDFLGKPDKSSHHNATTSTKLRTEAPIFTPEKVVLEFINEFEKHSSWFTTTSDALLKHEQIHFDISEIAVRKMRKKFARYKLTQLKVLNKDVNDAFSAAVQERSRLNHAYDNETHHGLIETEQKKWEKDIATELESLKEFASPQVRINK